MKKIFLFFFNILLLSNISFSQNIEKSEKYLKQGVSFLAEKDIANAEKYLKKSIIENKLNTNAYDVLGDLYFNLDSFKLAAFNYRIADSISNENYLKYKLANSYFMIGNYKSAKKKYQEYLINTPHHYKSYKIAKSRIRNCDFGINAMNDFKDFNPINIGKGINTPVYEYSPVVSADGLSMIYTTVRPKQGRNIEDFYISMYKDGAWQQGVPLPGNINTNKNEGAHCITSNGKFIFFTACGRSSGVGSCDIYISINNNGKWSQAINLGREVNTSAWDAHPAISPDGTTLIFSSTRPGGKGKKDLWMVKFNRGHWGVPTNISELNTSGNEVTPFFHADGKTLYFSSDGLPGMGGKDFFISRYDDKINEWGKPINLGYGINSSRDEYSLTVARDGKTAYFSTDALPGEGKMDIFSFVLPERDRAIRTVYLKGKIIDVETKEIITNSELTIVDLETQKPLNSIYIDNGNYMVLLPIDRTYAIVAMASNYLLYSSTFEFSVDSIIDFQVKNIELQRFKVGMKMNLNNIYFESGKYEILKKSYFELDLLVTYLMKYSNYKVKIIGHTDNIGTDEDNLELSLNRSKSVKKYLIDKGIKQERLETFGKGESQPVSENDTPQGRKKNRRTEIVLY